MKRTSMLATAAATLLALVLSGCGTSSGDGDDDGGDTGSEAQGGFTAPDIPMAEELGENEGTLSVLAWPGYAEDGSTDKSVDWVTPFEQETGCQVDVKYFGTSDEAVNLMKSGQYDVVSASGDASLRLIAAGDVAPVNTDLIENYADVWSFLKDREWNSVDGQMYGVPHGYGANLLMYNTDEVAPAPTSWSAVFDDASAHSGKVTAYDSPIYIADAALYLMNTQPDLGIEHPYSLDEDQLAAAVDLLKAQREHIGEYWSDYLKEIQAFKTGDSVVGTTWQVIVNLAQGEKAPVEAFLPEEGSTGWSDTWMVSS
jgi:putative spermidine/putrescine transport system substrate-binding protein